MDTNVFMRVEPTKKEHMKEVVALLQQISSFYPAASDYDKIWESFIAQPHVFSVVATHENSVVGYGALVLERKVRGGVMGHVEDIVVSKDHSSKGIGRMIVEALYVVARINGCYKVALQCQDRNIGFYERCGYKISGSMMQRHIEITEC